MGQASQRVRTRDRIDTLDGRVRPLGFALVGFAISHGLDLLVTQARRTHAEQEHLYAQGRNAPGKIVTHAQAGQSYHNYGLAFDVVEVDDHGEPQWSGTPWLMLGEFGESIGLAWGGRWSGKKRDRPHFQLADVPHWTALQSIAPDGQLPAGWSI